MKKLLIRFFAGVLASILLVTAVALIGNMPNGKRTDGVFYEASGIHPDASLLTVNNQPVTAEEYFYWLAYDCDYLMSYMGDVDFTAEISSGMTYADYVMNDAESTVTLYALVRAWAEQAGITLTEDDQTQLEAQRAEYVEYYGGEEGYAQQLQAMGLSDESFQSINSVYFLYADLHEAYCSEGGSLRPADDEIAAYADTNSYCTVLPLYWTVSGDEATDAASLAQAEEFAAQLQSASDKNTTYVTLAQQLAIDTNLDGETVSTEDLGEELADAIAALDENEVSQVIKTDSGYYIIFRKALDTDSLLETMFSDKLASLRTGASIKYNSRSYDKLDVADFYTKLTSARSAIIGAGDADTDTDTSTDTAADTGSSTDSGTSTDSAS